MQLNIIENSAEDLLFADIISEQQEKASDNANSACAQFLHCRFFQIAIIPDISDLKEIVNEAALDVDLTLYLCSDGDLIVKWYGNYEGACERIVALISKKYQNKISASMSINAFFIDYLNLDGIEKLRTECLAKLRKQTRQGKELLSLFSNPLLVERLSTTIQFTQMQRAFRKTPHFLIVEDQAFSRTLLTSILKDHTCYTSENAGEALIQYMEKCPDIVLLDVELPDVNGHILAKMLNKLDPNAYIVMVTGNKYERDIVAAKENNVKGFIVKPFKKEAILSVVDQFLKNRKKKSAT